MTEDDPDVWWMPDFPVDDYSFFDDADEARDFLILDRMD